MATILKLIRAMLSLLFLMKSCAVSTQTETKWEHLKYLMTSMLQLSLLLRRLGYPNMKRWHQDKMDMVTYKVRQQCCVGVDT